MLLALEEKGLEFWPVSPSSVSLPSSILPCDSDGKKSACNAGGLGLSPGQSLGEGWLPTPSILAWRIPWTEEPGGLQSMGHRELDVNE